MSQAVIVYLPLHGGDMGSEEERDVLFALQERMMEVLAEAGVGELDGDLWGEGECVLYLYGPDADRLYTVIEPLLKACPQASGGYAIKQYGDPVDPDVREERVVW